MDINKVISESQSAPQTQMPMYTSHKKVWALKIAKVHQDEHGQGIALQFEDSHFGLRAITSSQLEHKPVPEAGMYLIQYEDGYFSFSPAEAFEKGYDPAESEPVVEKITLIPGKLVLTPWGQMKSVRVTQESRWGRIMGELSLTGPQAISLAEEILKRRTELEKF